MGNRALNLESKQKCKWERDWFEQKSQRSVNNSQWLVCGKKKGGKEREVTIGKILLWFEINLWWFVEHVTFHLLSMWCSEKHFLHLKKYCFLLYWLVFCWSQKMFSTIENAEKNFYKMFFRLNKQRNVKTKNYELFWITNHNFNL